MGWVRVTHLRSCGIGLVPREHQQCAFQGRDTGLSKGLVLRRGKLSQSHTSCLLWYI